MKRLFITQHRNQPRSSLLNPPLLSPYSPVKELISFFRALITSLISFFFSFPKGCDNKQHWTSYYKMHVKIQLLCEERVLEQFQEYCFSRRLVGSRNIKRDLAKQAQFHRPMARSLNQEFQARVR